MSNVGVAMVGGNGKRRKDDFYPTPFGSTRPMLPILQDVFPRRVWEPFCGQGHMSQVLREDGYDVVSTDKVRRGYGTQLDFMQSARPLASAIISNPPFIIIDEILDHALNLLGVEHIAFLLPLSFWCAKGRVDLFEQNTPALVLPATWRIDSTGQKRPTMNFQWIVWTSALPPIRGFKPLVTEDKHAGSLDDDPLS